MRHLTRILFLLFLTFFSCSQQVEDGWESDELPCEHETHPVSVSFSRASLETFSESATGIAEGGRTGMTSLVAGIMFLIALFLAPVFMMILIAATTGPLVTV
jgi:hypothetical protein